MCLPEASGGPGVASLLQRTLQKLQDLARWADGTYRVAGEPVSDRKRRSPMAELISPSDF